MQKKCYVCAQNFWNKHYGDSDGLNTKFKNILIQYDNIALNCIL